MGFIFRPRGATQRNYMQYEKDLYIALETLKGMCQRGIIEKNNYIVPSNLPAYRSAYKYSYGLVKFYTKHREESKEFMFKRNFLLSKTRGLYSNQKIKPSKLFEAYLVNIEQLDDLSKNYLKMFKIEKLYEQFLKEQEEKKKA